MIELNLYLVNRNLLGFRMTFKVWLNQIFSKFITILWTIKYRFKFNYGVFHIYHSWAMALFLFENMVHSNVWKFEKIWLSGTLIIIRKPKKSLFSKRKRVIWTVNLKYTMIELNLYLVVHSIVNLSQYCGPLNTGLSSIMGYFTFTVPELWPFFS
jgi:hypothetical protein